MKLRVDIYTCGDCGRALCVEENEKVKVTPCCESEYWEYSHSGVVEND